MPVSGGDVAEAGVQFDPARAPFAPETTSRAGGGDLDERFQQLARQLVGERPEDREALLADFEREVTDRGILRGPPQRQFLLKFLRAGNFTVSVAVEVLESYLRYLRDFPHFVSPLSPEDVRSVGAQGCHCFLPVRDGRGRRIMLYRMGKWDANRVSFNQCFRLGYMLSEMVALESETQVAGVTVIGDASGFGWRHFRSITISDCQKVIKLVQESFPLCFRAFHVVNASSFFQMLFNLLRPMLSDEIRSIIFFHPHLDSLHAHVERIVLPEELGGATGPVDNQESLEALDELRQFFDEMTSLQGPLQEYVNV